MTYVNISATCFGYVGELCRYLLNQPPRADDRDHPLRKMIGNGLRPSIWKPFKERFGIEQVAELYASSEGNIGFTNFFNLDNTVGFSTAPYALVRYHEGTRDPIRNSKGFMEKVKQGEPGLLLGEINKKWSFEGYTQKDATEKSILRDVFDKGDAWFNTGDVLQGNRFPPPAVCRPHGRHLPLEGRERLHHRGGEPDRRIRLGRGSHRLRCGDSRHQWSRGHGDPGPLGREAIDMDKLFGYLQDNLPAYAIPVFIRVTDAIEKTGTFKYKKVDLKKDAYHLTKAGDQVYAWLPRTQGYTLLDEAAVDKIDNGDFQF